MFKKLRLLHNINKFYKIFGDEIGTTMHYTLADFNNPDFLIDVQYDITQVQEVYKNIFCEDRYTMSRWLDNIYEQIMDARDISKTGNNTISIILFIALVCAMASAPHIYTQVQHNNGTLLQVVEVYDVQPTDQGGFVKPFLVQDHEGNTHEVYTGFIVQWDKSEGSYINTKYLKGGNN